MKENIAFRLDVLKDGETVLTDRISFDRLTVYYKLFKVPMFSLIMTIQDWRDILSWKELEIIVELYDKYRYRFPITIAGARVQDRTITFTGIICYRDNMLIKRSRYLGNTFRSAYKKLGLYQTYRQSYDVAVFEEDDLAPDEDIGGSGFFQLNCTDIEMITMMMKGIEKDCLVSMSCDKLKVMNYRDAIEVNEGGYSRNFISTLVNNIKNSTEIKSINPITGLRLDKTEVQIDGYFRFKDKHHSNYEYRGVDSYFFNKDFNSNMMHNTLFDDGLEYSHVVQFSKYYDIELGSLIPYPTYDSINGLMVIGKEIELNKTSTVVSRLQVGVMYDEIK